MPDWVDQWAGLAMMSIGAGVALWALLWDRARGRSRCPGCWYDMGGSPGCCPECGREVRRPTELHRTRRRWRCAGFALVGVTAGALGPRVPIIRREGWAGLVPTTAL